MRRTNRDEEIQKKLAKNERKIPKTKRSAIKFRHNAGHSGKLKKFKL